jgi:hypothetical protein
MLKYNRITQLGTVWGYIFLTFLTNIYHCLVPLHQNVCHVIYHLGFFKVFLEHDLFVRLLTIHNECVMFLMRCQELCISEKYDSEVSRTLYLMRNRTAKWFICRYCCLDCGTFLLSDRMTYLTRYARTLMKVLCLFSLETAASADKKLVSKVK